MPVVFCLQCLLRPETGVQSPRTGVADVCEPACGCLETQPGPLQGRPPVLKAEHLCSPLRVFKVLQVEPGISPPACMVVGGSRAPLSVQSGRPLRTAQLSVEVSCLE